jgi:DNA transposition AAA+ family ATPase
MRNTIIATDNLAELQTRIELCPRNRRRFICCYGESGTGKTEATAYLARNYKTLTYTALAGLSVSAFARRLGKLVGQTPRSLDTAFDALVREIPARGYKLLVVDEADKLSPQSLEFIRSLTDQLSIITVLLGEERLFHLVHAEKRMVRRSTHVEFAAMSSEDAITVATELLQIPFAEDLIRAVWSK